MTLPSQQNLWTEEQEAYSLRKAAGFSPSRIVLAKGSITSAMGLNAFSTVSSVFCSKAVNRQLFEDAGLLFVDAEVGLSAPGGRQRPRRELPDVPPVRGLSGFDDEGFGGGAGGAGVGAVIVEQLRQRGIQFTPVTTRGSIMASWKTIPAI